MKKYIYISLSFLTLIAFTNKAGAQQDPMYTQYMFNALSLNPAYAGSRNVISATALFRNQWTGVPGAPETATFTIDAPIKDKKIGLGLQVFNDKLGISNTTGVVASGAYRIRMDRGTLSFGLQTSVSNFRANYQNVQLDQTGANNDLAFQDNFSSTLFNVGTGVYYNSDRFYLGLSAPQLINNRLTNTTTLSKQEIHLFLTAGIVLPLGTDFKLKPSVMVKGVNGAPIQGDLNATFWIKDVIGIGAQYRSNADVSGLFEIQATPQIRIGYAYDHSVTRLQSFNSGSHEIMLRYEFGFEKDKFISPRFF
ncbi:type IX secretion system membrane protein PorP/SprF [Pedobacter alpinus]|uniref:Type IX secretion system membrane protein PorP/SprF n=1 Tax=Pedobacter alpinus TaxID=1590643 RepID=A0ABW5TSM7_9SPHI